jgi:hypothetical protein
MRMRTGAIATLVGIVAVGGKAYGQIYAVSVNTKRIYEIDPDVPTYDDQAGFNPNMFNSAGDAFDGRYHYSEHYPNGDSIAKVDLTGVDLTVVYDRTYPHPDGSNNCLAVDGDGTLWEIDRSTLMLYPLVFDDGGPPTVSRGGGVEIGLPDSTQFGDIAWGPNGLLYIATNNAGQANFVWDPITGTLVTIGDTEEQYTGIAWYNGKLYGSKSAPNQAGELYEVDPTNMSALDPPILTDLQRLNDLAAWPIGPAVSAVDLCAGQDLDVGEVEVSKDACTLHVRFVTDGTWLMSQTHLHVATDWADIPQTKKGNPIPGHFDYSMDHDDLTSEYTYDIPLEDLGGEGTYYLAAHAVVLDTESMAQGEQSFASQPGVDVYGPADMYMAFGDPGWGTGNPAAAAWVHPGWTQEVAIPGATWISTAEDVEQPLCDSWRLFHEEFEIPFTALNIDGTVTVTADNAEEVYLNGMLVGNDGPVSDTAYRATWEWATELIDDLAGALNPGVNQLDFIVRNYAQSDGTAASNPTGLIYDVSVVYDYYDHEETAWGDGCEGTSFPGNNWGTYFTYEVVGCD